MLRCGCHHRARCGPGASCDRRGTAPMSAPVQLPLPLTGPLEGDTIALFGGGAAEPGPVERLLVRDASDKLRVATAAEIIAAAPRAITRRARRRTGIGSPRAGRGLLSIKPGTLQPETISAVRLAT